MNRRESILAALGISSAGVTVAAVEAPDVKHAPAAEPIYVVTFPLGAPILPVDSVTSIKNQLKEIIGSDEKIVVLQNGGTMARV